MFDSIVVMPGLARIDLTVLEAAAKEFGCSVTVANSLNELAARQTAGKTLAVIFHRGALGAGCSWSQSLRILNRAIPGVRLIACHGYAERVDWTELSDAGAFHYLGLPLKSEEVRQSLGFVTEAEKRANLPVEPPAKIAPIRSAGNGPGTGRFDQAAARVMTRAAS
jgi:DNA-binding NtrC family response regulator